MRRVNKPFDLAEGVQAEADLRIDLSSFQMKILRDGEMAQWLRKGPALQGNPSSILSIHVGELTTVRKSSFGGSNTLFWPTRVQYYYTRVHHHRPHIHNLKI